MRTESNIDSWSGLWAFDVKSSPIMESVELNGPEEGKIYFLQHDLDLHRIPYLAEKAEKATPRVQRAWEHHQMLNWRNDDASEDEIMVVEHKHVMCAGRQVM
jgi:hypothetical protein